MKPFFFRFQRILNLRNANEQMRQAEFGVERRKLDEEAHKLSLFQEEAEHQQDEMRTGRESAFSARDQNLGIKYLSRVTGVIEFQTGMVNKQQRQVEMARERLTEAQRETEIMKRLREKQQTSWNSEMLREERIELDEVGGRQTWRATHHEAE